jgi:hypothetical protein
MFDVGNTNQRRFLNLLDPVNGAFYGPIYQTNDGETLGITRCCFPFSAGLQHYSFMANYTWSHCTSEADTGGDLGQASAVVMNPNNLRQDPWQLPIGSPADFQQFSHCADRILLGRAATGGQRLADVSHYDAQSGPWQSVTTGSDTSLTASRAAASLQDRANVVGDWRRWHSHNWFSEPLL